MEAASVKVSAQRTGESSEEKDAVGQRLRAGKPVAQSPGECSQYGRSTRLSNSKSRSRTHLTVPSIFLIGCSVSVSTSANERHACVVSVVRS